MMKSFRRRFILLNISLVGVVLLTALVMSGAIISGNVYSELENSMSNVLKPWRADTPEVKKSSETQTDDTPKEKKDKAPEKPDEKKENDSQKKDNAVIRSASDKKREHNDNITTIFYYKKDKKTSVLSSETVFDSDPDELVSAIIGQDKDFGEIVRYNIIYYREESSSVVKIAVCDRSYVGSRLFRIFLILALAYVLSMLVLLLISMRLARFAERPLRRSIEMECKFVADVSHDLKTPITVIMANNSILKANGSALVSDNMQWIESTDRASEDMMQLIDNMLTMSEADTHPGRITCAPVSLTSAVEGCILQFESVAYEKNVELNEEIGEGLTVSASEGYLKRICSSLIDNALKYEPEGGRVTVKAYSRKHKVIFSVHNLNSRIPPEDLPHIFDRFYRGDKARTGSAGHGLGLPIIKQMASVCGADTEAVSNETDGTVFTVMFRRA